MGLKMNGIHQVMVTADAVIYGAKTQRH